jgi:hypoxanthine phosphoribosyltransferase
MTGYVPGRASMPSPKIEVLYDEAAIASRVNAIAAAIAATRPERLLVVAILKGSFMFAADLLRAMHREKLALDVEFMMLSSYGAGTLSSGAVKIIRDIDTDVTGRAVLLVDDILESGRTLAFAKTLLEERGATKVEVAVLLEKPGKRRAEIDADYIGYVCPDSFVVGYGMDAAHAWRELPFVGIVTTDPA